MTITERQLELLRQVFRPTGRRVRSQPLVEPQEMIDRRQKMLDAMEEAERRADALVPPRTTQDEKEAAWKVYQKAVAKGELQRPDKCEFCGHPSRRIYGHHTDYSKPLAVVWVCGGCHSFIHLPSRRKRIA